MPPLSTEQTRKARSDNKCYYCGNPATSHEHVPPKCLFPKKGEVKNHELYKSNLITVPSCQTHNSMKSGDDEYLLYVLAMNLPANHVGQSIAETRLMRAIDRKPELINQLLSKSGAVVLHDTINKISFDTLAIPVDFTRLENIFTHIAKGVYFHTYKQNFVGRVRVIPHFLDYQSNDSNNETNDLIDHVLALSEELLKLTPTLGNNIDVFSYQLYSEPNRSLLMRMNFYQDCKVTTIMTLKS